MGKEITLNSVFIHAKENGGKIFSDYGYPETLYPLMGIELEPYDYIYIIAPWLAALIAGKKTITRIGLKDLASIGIIQSADSSKLAAILHNPPILLTYRLNQDSANIVLGAQAVFETDRPDTLLDATLTSTKDSIIELSQGGQLTFSVKDNLTGAAFYRLGSQLMTYIQSSL